MLCPYELKAFSEQLNLIKVDDYGINPMEKFAGKTTYIILKNRHTWVSPVCVLDAILQVNISVLPKWEPRSRTGIYLGHLPFNSG